MDAVKFTENPLRSRRNNKQTGKAGEDIAILYLEEKGYKIIERNYRCLYGEIDIIANDGGSLIFVEVKSRKSERFGDPVAAVDINKQKKISRSASNYLKERGLSGYNARFDVVSVRLLPQGSRVELIRNAFDLVY